jgi:Glycosyl transferase family 2
MSGWLPPEFQPGLVSVIIPTRDRSALLGETLESVLQQTHDEVEVLVVDDGSEDDTPAALERWRERFRAEHNWDLKCLRQEHLGAQAARNLGARASRGEFLNYLDDDDLLSADKIAAQVHAARRSHAELVYGPWAYFIHDAAGLGLRPVHNAQPRGGDAGLFAAWLRGWSWCVMAGLLTRDLADRVGPWNESLRVCNDLDLSARCFRLEPRVSHCPEGMFYRRHHRDSVSNAPFTAYEPSLEAFARGVEELAMEALPGEAGHAALAQFLGAEAIKYFARGSVRGAEFCAARAREHDPGYRPQDAGLCSRLAFALGGFRLLARKNLLRDRLKGLSRRLRGKTGGFRRVPALDLAPAAAKGAGND